MPCAIAVMKGSTTKLLALARSLVPAFFRGEFDRARHNVALDDFVEQSHTLGLLCGPQFALEHEVERHLHARHAVVGRIARGEQARQALRAAGARQ